MAAQQRISLRKGASMTSLRQRFTEDMQIRNLAVNTQQSYVRQVSQFARHFNQSPELLGPEQIRAYQVYLTNERKLAAGSIIIAISALRFLYKVTLKKHWSLDDIIPAPKVPQTLPVVLSPEEVVHFLECVESRKHRTILTTCYAAGLRISESIALTPSAIDSKRMVLRIEQGQKDRYVMLSPKLLEIFRSWWWGQTEGQAAHGRGSERKKCLFLNSGSRPQGLTVMTAVPSLTKVKDTLACAITWNVPEVLGARYVTVRELASAP
jgi:site-specific recombinase XerD